MKPREAKISFILVCHSYPPVLGGSEIEAERVSQALSSRGHSVTVLCAGNREMPVHPTSWIDPKGVKVHVIGRSCPRRLLDYWFALGVVWYLLRHRREYDLVYFLMQGLHLAAGLPTARTLNKPIVFKVSGSGILPTMQQSWLGRLELKWLVDWAFRILVLNDGMKREALDAGIPLEKLLWMPNPVDVTEFAPATPEGRQQLRRMLDIPQDALLLVFVGRLAPEKEIFSLLDGIALATSRLPNLRAVFVGDGPLATQLQQRAADLGLTSAVQFAGRQPVDVVRQWLQAGDVFALVSSLEGFPCSLVEAMSAGLPSVVSRIPANTQLIEHGREGLTTELKNEQAIADALVQLGSDPQLRSDMGRAARENASRYSLDDVAYTYETLFANALQKGQLARAENTAY